MTCFEGPPCHVVCGPHGARSLEVRLFAPMSRDALRPETTMKRVETRYVLMIFALETMKK